MPLDAQPHVRLESRETGPFHTRNASPCGRYWAVVHTHPQAERWACANLTRRGYECFLPLCTVRRRDRAIRSLFHAVQVPAFPRYAFVSIDTGWAPIRYIPGVHDLLMSDGKPGIVARAAIEALRAVQDLPAPQMPFAPGTPCSLLSGPLASMPAVVLDVGPEMALVSVMMFGALREMAVPLSNLTARE